MSYGGCEEQMTAELPVESRARRPVTREISTFLLLAFFISAIPWSLVIFTGHLMTGGYLTVNLLMWCPALAAFSVCLLRRIPLSTIGWKWPAAKYLRLGYTIPILYAIPVYLLTWIFVPESFILPTFLQASAKLYRILHHPYLATFAMNIPLLLTAQLVASLPRALGEEIGWRGFLLPRLVERFGFTTGCFSGGIIWALWHSPVLLGADYNVGTNRIYALACFTIMVTADTYILGLAQD
jgi:membrane protease YdiL (CAAX protease family)